MNKVIKYFKNLDLIKQANILIKEAKVVSSGITNLRGYFTFNREKNYATPAEYCADKILNSIIQNFISLAEIKFTNRGLDLIKDLNDNPLDYSKIINLSKKFKPVIYPKIEQSFFEKLLKSEIDIYI